MISWNLSLWIQKVLVVYRLQPQPCLITRRVDIWTPVIAIIITVGITIITITITIITLIDWELGVNH